MSVQEVIAILLTVTALASYINYKFIKLPKSIGLTLVTLVLSLLFAASGKLGWDVDKHAHTLLEGIGFNETFLHGMLSFLLFAGALHINVVELFKYKTIVAILATVGVAISTVLVGYATFGLTQFLSLDIPFYYCMVFGALISPTDPIAVLGILKTAKAPKAFEMKIAGEALFNDGMGIVLFFVLLSFATGQSEVFSPAKITWLLLQAGVGGILFGTIVGWAMSRILQTIDEYEVAILVTLAGVTGAYTLAHAVLNVSGPITIAVAGLLVGINMRQPGCCATKETIERLDGFWELLDEVLNAVLFVLLGLEFLRLTFTVDTSLAAIGAIIITIAARWISVMVPIGGLSIFRKFGPNVVMVLTWGGLRGGISIALALSTPPGPARDFIVVITYAVVIFSIMVQGLTMGPLVRHIFNKEESATPKLKSPRQPAVEHG